MSQITKANLSTFQTLFDIEKVRKDFPILHRQVYGKPLVYLDNAATTHKPQTVIDAINNFNTTFNSNVHRGVHHLSEVATKEYEDARKKIQRFINAKSNKEIIFVRGATEGINLIASTFGKSVLEEGDEILITEMEHHSNIVPWQMLCNERKANLRVCPINDDGEIIFEEFEKLLNEKTKLVSVVHVSNSLGTINPVKKIIDASHKKNIPVIVDGAQAIQHFTVDVKELDCDFYVFSGHKAYAPTGIGVVYGKETLLKKMSPYQGGGDMISTVSFEKTTYNELPYKFEAGTPNIEGAIGLGAAIDYLTETGLRNIQQYEHELLEYGTKVLSEINGLKIIGTAKEKASVISFVIENIHPHDIGTMLDRDGVAIRTGHHCTMPLMKRFNVPATSRVSLSFYNTKQELDTLAESLIKAIKLFE